MNKSETILADSIAIQPDLVAFDLAIAQFLKTIPLEKLLVYDVDNIQSEGLPLLALQFDVLGYKGMRMAPTDADKRNLIKRAIELHKYKGTPYAIKESLRTIGFNDIVLERGVAGPEPRWANIRVILSTAQANITNESIAALRLMIDEYKSSRDNLTDVVMIIEAEDTLLISDDDYTVEIDVAVEDVLVLSGAHLYDGSADYDGSIDHSYGNDIIEII